MSLYLLRQEVTVTDLRLPILSECYIQALANSRPGLHLIVTTRGHIEPVYDTVTNGLYEHGFKTAAITLLKNKELVDGLFNKLLRLIVYALDARTYLTFKNYSLMTSLLGLLARFPKEQLSKIEFHNAFLKQVTIEKVKVALSQCASRNTCRRPTQQEVLLVCHEAIEQLNQAQGVHPANFALYESLTKFVKYVQEEKHFDIGLYARTMLKPVLQALNMRDKACRTAYRVFYFVVSHFIVLLTKEPDSANPPDNDQLQSLVNLLPHRSIKHYQDLLCDDSAQKTAILATEAILPMEQIEWDRLLKCPLRSIHVYGMKMLNPKEWQQQQLFSFALIEQSLARYPNEPPPFRAFFA